MNDYEARQQQKDAQYERAWEKLGPAQRKAMAKLGIHGPERPAYRLGKPDDEAYLERVAGVRDPDPLEESPEGPPGGPEGGATDWLWQSMRRLIALLRAQDNVRLSLDCFALVSGMHYEGESMADIARRHGVTRAAVSKRCIDLAESLGLPPTAGMRRLTTRARYERRARHCHLRNAH